MWLIDHNLPHTFYRVLKEKNISCQTTSFAKLGHLENGVLTRAAIDAGFTAIITRDRTFPLAAQDTLAKHPGRISTMALSNRKRNFSSKIN